VKAHVLLNVLNHVPGDSEWDGCDTLTLPDGREISIVESAKTMRPGESCLKEAREDHDDTDHNESPAKPNPPDNLSVQ
jgi:hypothetical protein